jgi:hypothetical protein
VQNSVEKCRAACPRRYHDRDEAAAVGKGLISNGRQTSRQADRRWQIGPPGEGKSRESAILIHQMALLELGKRPFYWESRWSTCL